MSVTSNGIHQAGGIAKRDEMHTLYRQQRPPEETGDESTHFQAGNNANTWDEHQLFFLLELVRAPILCARLV